MDMDAVSGDVNENPFVIIVLVLTVVLGFRSETKKAPFRVPL